MIPVSTPVLTTSPIPSPTPSPIMQSSDKGDQEPRIKSLSLIDAITDIPLIGDMVDGETITLPQRAGRKVNIRANLNDAAISSGAGAIVFDFDEDKISSCREKVAPYALFGDVRSDYRRGILPPGNHQVTAYISKMPEVTITVSFTVRSRIP